MLVLVISILFSKVSLPYQFHLAIEIKHNLLYNKYDKQNFNHENTISLVRVSMGIPYEHQCSLSIVMRNVVATHG